MRSQVVVVIVAVIVAVLLLALTIGPGFYIEYLWFDSLGQAPVYLLQFTTQGLLLLGVTVVSLAFLAANILLAQRFSLHERFVVAVNRRRGTEVAFDPRLVTALALIAAAGVSLMMGLGATETWTDWLRFQNATPFGVADPIFGLDAGFYVFTLPIYLEVRTWLLWLIGIALAVTVLIYGGGRLATAVSGLNYRGAGIVHLSILGALWLTVQAWSYLLHRYELLFVDTGLVSGPGYTAVNAQIPADNLLAIVVGIGIIALVANLFVRRLAIVWGALGLWLAVTVVVGGIYPGLVQRFVVAPNELALESPYLEHAIAFTSRAYGLDAIQASEFETGEALTAADVAANPDTFENVRLWDYRPLLTTYGQIQEIRRYYDFRDVDVEHYIIGGRLRQIMLAAREINVDQLTGEAEASWINRHLIYTHGYGVAANQVSAVGQEGLPVLLVRDLPPVSTVPELAIVRPEIYFGEETTDYVIVNTGEKEFDYPQGDQNMYAIYAGSGGVPLGSAVRRLAFASVFGSTQLLLSPQLTDGSRVLYHRTIQERVNALAPFLLYDGDPYLVIANGRLVWVQDAYTYDQRFPYSAMFVDPYPASGRDKSSIAGADLNYVRNAVKVTIDAYDGTTTFYVSDPSDPIIQTWRKIYPTLFQPLDNMDPVVRSRLRYPEGLFRAQAALYATYHMRDPRVFYNREDQWALGRELGKTTQSNAPEYMEPYYVIVRLPGRTEAEFVLIVPFTPLGKDNMIAWMYAGTTGGDRNNLGVFKFGKQELIYGPLQIEGRINQDPTISAQLTLWNQQGSNVIRGNLLVIPVDGSLVYVEPIYLQSDSGQLPELKRVIVAYGTQIAMAERFDAALAQVLGIAGGQEPQNPPTTPVSGDVAELARAAADHYDRAQACLESGDWACYGEEQKALREVLDQLVAATQQ